MRHAPARTPHLTPQALQGTTPKPTYTDIKKTPEKHDIESMISGNEGVDTVRLTGSYTAVINLFDRIELSVTDVPRNSPINPYLKTIEKQLIYDPKRRYKEAEHRPIIEQVKLTSGRGLSNYAIIIRNTPALFDMAVEKKKAKDYYCMVIFTGLHQPTKHISSEAMRVISRVLRRQGLKLYDIDIATDYHTAEEVKYSQKEAFTERTKDYNGGSTIVKGHTIYCNVSTVPEVSRFMIYDKYHKQQQYHRQKGISDELKGWRRFEATVRPERPGKVSFTDFIASAAFVEALFTVRDIHRRFSATPGRPDYLEYQISAILDNRTMNNNESRKRFNSPGSLERFKLSDFRRYSLP